MTEADNRREAVLRQIIEAAKAGWRAPQLEDFDVKNVPQALRELTKRGDIRIELYALNWRVIEILTGEHRGLRTAERPGRRSKPWKVIDANGTHSTERQTPVSRPRAGQPSAPRLLRADEIR